MQLSFNKLKTFGECALKYRYAYVERLPRPPVKSLAFHRRVHAALSDYHRLARRDGSVSEEELMRAYAKIAGADEDRGVRESRAFQEGEEILRLYASNEREKGRVPAYLEHPLKVEFGPYLLTGTVDRLDFTPGGGYALIDYKLDRKLPKANAAEDNLQLSFYDLLVYEGLGVAPEEVSLYYLRHGVEQTSYRTPDDRRQTLAWLEETAAAIRAERGWAPQEGPACRTCPFQLVCPAKTGKARPHAVVWQQAQIPWEPAEAPQPANLQLELFQ
jgi:CRISPR/Cas system-associated exonuclease Cas4 (RecB family)